MARNTSLNSICNAIRLIKFIDANIDQYKATVHLKALEADVETLELRIKHINSILKFIEVSCLITIFLVLSPSPKIYLIEPMSFLLHNFYLYITESRFVTKNYKKFPDSYKQILMERKAIEYIDLNRILAEIENLYRSRSSSISNAIGSLSESLNYSLDTRITSISNLYDSEYMLNSAQISVLTSIHSQESDLENSILSNYKSAVETRNLTNEMSQIVLPIKRQRIELQNSMQDDRTYLEDFEYDSPTKKANSVIQETDITVKQLIDIIQLNDKYEISFNPLEDLLSGLSSYTYYAIYKFSSKTDKNDIDQTRIKRNKVVEGAINYLKLNSRFVEKNCSGIIDALVLHWFKAFLAENSYIVTDYFDAAYLSDIISPTERSYLLHMKIKYEHEQIYTHEYPPKIIRLHQNLSPYDLRSIMESTKLPIDNELINHLHDNYVKKSANDKALFLTISNDRRGQYSCSTRSVTSLTSKFYLPKLKDREINLTKHASHYFSVEYDTIDDKVYTENSNFKISNIHNLILYMKELSKFTKQVNSDDKSMTYSPDNFHLLNIPAITSLSAENIQVMQTNCNLLLKSLIPPLIQFVLETQLPESHIYCDSAHIHFTDPIEDKPTPLLSIVRSIISQSYVLEWRKYIEYLDNKGLLGIYMLDSITDIIQIGLEVKLTDLYTAKKQASNPNIKNFYKDTYNQLFDMLNYTNEMEGKLELIPLRINPDVTSSYANHASYIFQKLDIPGDQEVILMSTLRIEKDAISDHLRAIETHLHDRKYLLNKLEYEGNLNQELAVSLVSDRIHAYTLNKSSTTNRPGVIESTAMIDNKLGALPLMNIELTPEMLGQRIWDIPDLKSLYQQIKPTIYDTQMLDENDDLHQLKVKIIRKITEITGGLGPLYNLYYSLMNDIPITQELSITTGIQEFKHYGKAIRKSLKRIDSGNYMNIENEVVQAKQYIANEHLSDLIDMLDVVYDEMKDAKFFGTYLLIDKYLELQENIFKYIISLKNNESMTKVKINVLKNIITVSKQAAIQSLQRGLADKLDLLYRFCMTYTKNQNIDHDFSFMIASSTLKYIIRDYYLDATKQYGYKRALDDMNNNFQRLGSSIEPPTIGTVEGPPTKELLNVIIEWHYSSCIRTAEVHSEAGHRIISKEEYIHSEPLALPQPAEKQNLAHAYSDIYEIFHLNSAYAISINLSIDNDTYKSNILVYEFDRLMKVYNYYLPLKLGMDFSDFCKQIALKETCRSYQVKNLTEFNPFIQLHDIQTAHQVRPYYQECSIIATSVACKDNNYLYISQFLVSQELEKFHNPESDPNVILYTRRFNLIYVCFIYPRIKTTFNSKEFKISIDKSTRDKNQVVGKIYNKSIISLPTGSKTTLKILFDRYLSAFGLSPDIWILPNILDVNASTMYENLHIIYEDLPKIQQERPDNLTRLLYKNTINTLVLATKNNYIFDPISNITMIRSSGTSYSQSQVRWAHEGEMLAPGEKKLVSIRSTPQKIIKLLKKIEGLDHDHAVIYHDIKEQDLREAKIDPNKNVEISSIFKVYS